MSACTSYECKVVLPYVMVESAAIPCCKRVEFYEVPVRIQVPHTCSTKYQYVNRYLIPDIITKIVIEHVRGSGRRVGYFLFINSSAAHF